ncbi:GNAT family N-acetyltransferase [Fluviicola sp.]|uniref:GNAT family N-acetyltransferase n=1 Tax=Fluviicola sp. TaxID=1917219 RepID=UPI0031E3E41B
MRSYKCLPNSSYESGHFQLVPIRDEDQLLIMKWRNEQIYHLRQVKPLTKEDQKHYFETVVSELFTQTHPKQLLFSFLENDTCIGYGGLVHINWIDKHAEVSFIMNTELEAERFAEIWTAYLELLPEIAFTDLGLHKLFTYAYDLRPHLFPVLENSGFMQEARLKDHCLFNGAYKDVLIHSLWNSEQPHIYLREASEEDLQLLFDWANEPSVRANSLNSEPIPFETHQKWFQSQLTNPDSKLFILTDGVEPLGQIRIQKKDLLWEIGYSIDKKHRGKKLGAAIVHLLVEKFNDYSFKAIVKKENTASLKVFENLGFETIPTDQTDILTFVKKSNP